MFSFFQTIFHKVTTVIATAAIAIGFISAPEPPKQPVLDNQIPTVAEQQFVEQKPQAQKKQDEFNISAETEKLKKEIEILKKGIGQQNQLPAIVNQPAQQPQVQKVVPPRPENSDEWTFNWDTWAWEKHPSAPPIVPTINAPPSNQQVIITNNTIVDSIKIILIKVYPEINSANIEWQTNQLTESKVFILKDGFSPRVFPSNSGASFRHIVDVFNLIPDTEYNFEIEAISDKNNITKTSGSFRTLSVPISVKLGYKPLNPGVYGSSDIIQVDTTLLSGELIIKIIEGINIDKGSLEFKNPRLLITRYSFCYNYLRGECLAIEIPGWRIDGELGDYRVYKPIDPIFAKVNLIIKDPLKKFTWSDGSQELIIKYSGLDSGIQFHADGVEITDCRSGYRCEKDLTILVNGNFGNLSPMVKFNVK